jgi:hypothetical protein
MHSCAPSAYTLAHLAVLTIVHFNSTSILSLYIMRMDSELETDSSDSSFLNISSSASASLILLKESSKASVTRLRHFIKAYIQAVTLLNKNVPHYEITT